MTSTLELTSEFTGAVAVVTPTVAMQECSREIGHGRAARVYRQTDALGREIARKVFVGEPLSRFVLHVLTGAANPYTWNRDAIRAAVSRRRILRQLVRFWFADRLRIPRTAGARWNRQEKAFELRAEFIRGRHVPLQGRAKAGHDPLSELTRDIMRPLQDRLEEAGFDGMVWQAGRGNPVAAGNFLVRRRHGLRQWVWIDLESGVPALFPLNPLALIRFYLPKSIHHRRWLFDDVDIPQLRWYLTQHETRIKESLGADGFASVQHEIDRLDRHQSAWRSLNRTQRGVAYFRSRDRISSGQAEHFEEHPWHWQAFLAKHAVVSLAKSASWRVASFAQWISELDFPRLGRQAVRFCASQHFRRIAARRVVSGRLRSWQERRFLKARTVRRLRRELKTDQAGQCVTDFGMHMLVKPLVKSFQWWLLPVLFLLGWLREPWLALLLVSCGAAVRTLYTAARCVQSAVRRERMPWLALAVGVFPVVGNAAFPLQLVYWSRDTQRELPSFLLFDLFAGFGRAVPIWGGADTLLEHWSNRIPNLLLKKRLARALETQRD